MSAYIVRRILYAIPILIGVNLVTFFLFFFVNTPDDMARLHLGAKRVTEEQVSKWKRERGYDLPYFYNSGWTETAIRQVSGSAETLTFNALKPGEYRIRVERPNPGEGRLEITLHGAEASTLPALPATFQQGRIRVDLAAAGTEQIPFPLPGLTTPLELKLEPSQGAPMAVVFVDFKEQLSPLQRVTQTIFWKKSIKFLMFQFGKSDDGRNIGDEIAKRVSPSLALAIPTFLIGILVNITAAMFIAFYRGTYLDFWGVVTCVVLMSISIMFYIIGGQWLLGKVLKLYPISGFDTGVHAFKFVLLPVVIGIIGGVGSGIRWYRTIFLEEMGKDYVRTARAKGLPESLVLFKHALKNAMIPILTGVVVTIPMLFMGSLLLESFFSIPGMGSFTLEAIQRQDFAIVQAMVFLGSMLYVVGLMLTDISYTLVDPRVRLE